MKMSQEAKEKLAKFNAEQNDWYAVCKRCGLKLRGTIKQLIEHKCEVHSE